MRRSVTESELSVSLRKRDDGARNVLIAASRMVEKFIEEKRLAR